MLQLTGASKRYDEVIALDNASIEVRPGRMLGFLGPNGAGKTTAMRAVFGLVRLDAGYATWNGSPITIEELLQFGYIPVERGLYPKMKIGDQLRYFARLHGLSSSDATAAAFWLNELGIGDRENEVVRLTMALNVELADVLCSVTAAGGRVDRLNHQPPTLSEIFHEAVQP